MKSEIKKKDKKKKYKVERYKGAKLKLKEYNQSKKRQKIDKSFSKPKLISFIVLWVILYAISVLYAVFRCKLSYIRLWDSIKDLGISFVFYLTWFYPFNVTPSVNDIPNTSVNSILPDTFEAFGEKLSGLWSNIWNFDNFTS